MNYILNIASTVATVGATVLALWLALRENLRRVDAVFVWGSPTEYQPMLFVQNIGNRAIVVDRIIVKYKRKQVCNIDFFASLYLRDSAIIKAHEDKEIPIDPNLMNICIPRNQKKKYTLKVTVSPRQGRKFVTKQKYSYDVLGELLFGSAFWGSD